MCRSHGQEEEHLRILPPVNSAPVLPSCVSLAVDPATSVGKKQQGGGSQGDTMGWGRVKRSD